MLLDIEERNLSMISTCFYRSLPLNSRRSANGNLQRGIERVPVGDVHLVVCTKPHRRSARLDTAEGERLKLPLGSVPNRVFHCAGVFVTNMRHGMTVKNDAAPVAAPAGGRGNVVNHLRLPLTGNPFRKLQERVIVIADFRISV